MGVYHVHTHSVDVPSYIVYQCPKCKNAIGTVAFNKMSESFSDRQYWTKKGVAKRDAEVRASLESRAKIRLDYLRGTVSKITTDYKDYKCVCHKCGHMSLSKLGGMPKLKLLIQMGPMAIIFVAEIVSLLRSSNSIGDELLFAAFVAFFGGGVLGSIIDAILESIEKSKIKRAFEKLPPLISLNRELLLNEAMKWLEYKNIDCSTVFLK